MRNQALRCRRQNRRRIPSSVRRTGHAAAALRFNNYPLSSQSQFVDGIVMAGVYTLFGLNFVAFKNPPNAIFIRKLSVRSEGQLVQILKSILYCPSGKLVKDCF